MLDVGLEVGNISRDQGQTVDFCSSCDECVREFHGASRRLACGHQFPAGIGYYGINRNKPPFETLLQAIAKPIVQRAAAPTGRKAFNAVTQFGDGYHA